MYMKDDKINRIIQETLSDILLELSKKLQEEGRSDDDIMKMIDGLDVKGLVSDTYNDLSQFMVEKLQGCMQEYVMRERQITRDFLILQEKKWDKCFVMSEALYYFTVEAVDNYHKSIIDNKIFDDNNSGALLYKAIRRLHARALQQYLEITYLVKCGFADGAFARWRSMYEISVVTNFIINNGERVAKSYLSAANSNDRYEWARSAKCFKKWRKQYITFGDIQNKCSFVTETWKRQYELANQALHASPQGTMWRIGDNDTSRNMLLAGHSDYGIQIPAENAAISLAMITNMFLKLHPYGEGRIVMKSINKWVDLLKVCYDDTCVVLFDKGEINDAM